MFRRDMAAKAYRVLKPFVFRGIQYEPDGIFDPVAAQCTPFKLDILIRQRFLGDDGPSLAQAIKEAVPHAPVAEQPTESDSDSDSGNANGLAEQEPEQEPEQTHQEGTRRFRRRRS